MTPSTSAMPIIAVMSSFCRLTLRRVSPRACLYWMPRCREPMMNGIQETAQLAKRLRSAHLAGVDQRDLRRSRNASPRSRSRPGWNAPSPILRACSQENFKRSRKAASGRRERAEGNFARAPRAPYPARALQSYHLGACPVLLRQKVVVRRSHAPSLLAACVPAPLPASFCHLVMMYPRPIPVPSPSKLTIISLRRACRPGIQSCASSTPTVKRRRATLWAPYREGYARLNVNPVSRKATKCSIGCGRIVTIRYEGAKTESATMANSRSHAATCNIFLNAMYDRPMNLTPSYAASAAGSKSLVLRAKRTWTNAAYQPRFMSTRPSSECTDSSDA